METSFLKHKISIDNSKFNCLISISLHDECKNGIERFSITADFWIPKENKLPSKWLCSGCTHDKILKAKPNLKIFVDLHLCDLNGYPMYYVGNAFYFLKKEMSKNDFIKKYEITSEQYDELLNKSMNEDEFGYLLIKKFKNHLIWEKKAKKAIALLEKMTDKKFVSKATKIYSIEKWLNLEFPENWFEKENVERRKKEKFLYEQNEKISALEKEHKRKIEEMQNEFSIKKSLMQLGFLDLCNTRHYFNEREFHINVKRNVLSSGYRIENSKLSYTFTEEDYEQMHIGLPPGYRLIFNSYE